jgi:tRNA threonylcarbamoyladenosine biosynthesis protein TsaB
LARGDQLLEEVELAAPEGFSGILFQQIEALLRRHGTGLPGVDLYAAAAGPGSFTGVRIGLTAVKALAEMHGRQVVPVSNLSAIALMAHAIRPDGTPLLAPVVDARRGEVAGAVYTRTLERLLDPMVAAPEVFAARVAEFGEALYCGPDAASSAPGGAPCLTTPRALAAAIARLAAAGRGVDPALADAEYVRRADVRKPR